MTRVSKWPFPSRDPRFTPEPTPAPVEDQIEPDEADPTCPECHGDGRDKSNDYLLPCPTCGGERYV